MKINNFIKFAAKFILLVLFSTILLPISVYAGSTINNDMDQVVSKEINFQYSYNMLKDKYSSWSFNKSGEELMFLSWLDGNSDYAPLNLPLKIAFPPGVDLTHFNQLWIDEYSASNCSFDIDLDVESNFWGEPNVSANNYKSDSLGIKIFSKVNFEKDQWQPRDQKYLLARFFGLTPDSSWRYKKIGDRLLSQRRMHLNLKGTDLIILKLKPGVLLDQVNLKLTREKIGSRGNIVEIPIPQHDVMLSDDGTLTINASKVIPQADRDNDTYLSEIFLYFSSDISGDINDVLIKGLSLARFDSFTQLPKESFRVNNSLSRNIIDISPVIKIANSVALKKAALRISKKNNNLDCFGKIKSIRLISLRPSLVPDMVKNLQKQVKKYGGPFLLTAPKD